MAGRVSPKPEGWWLPKSGLGPSAIPQYGSYLFLKHKVGVSFSFQKTSRCLFSPSLNSNPGKEQEFVLHSVSSVRLPPDLPQLSSLNHKRRADLAPKSCCERAGEMAQLLEPLLLLQRSRVPFPAPCAESQPPMTSGPRVLTLSSGPHGHTHR